MEGLVLKELQNIGAMMILAILVLRLPNIISAFNSGVQLIINNVMQIQEKALLAFKDQNEKDREYNGVRFEKIENSLEKIGEALNTSMAVQNKILGKQEDIEKRLDRLEKT